MIKQHLLILACTLCFLAGCVKVNLINPNDNINFIYIVPVNQSLIYVSVPFKYQGYKSVLLRTIAKEFCVGKYSTTRSFKSIDSDRFLIECEVKQPFVLDYYSIIPIP